MRLAVVLIFASVVCGLVYFVFTHPNLERLEEMEAELSELEHQNEKLAERNDELERQIRALRDDPRLAGRRARESVGLVRPGELIFQFEQNDEIGVIEVPLEVEAERVVLAGEEVGLDELTAELRALDDEIEHPRLTLEIGEEVGPVRRQRVVDMIDASPLSTGGSEETGRGGEQ